MKTNFSVNTGKYHKYFEDYLEKDKWEKYIATFSDADYKTTSKPFLLCAFF
ncbi:MAG: aminoglycoside 6-adenylyltransferase [Candidatus Cloacimonetes bacterium]|nr:aminoglycoside 6-adenylyltransferase [Candidatus Cloacimonadota bacterium]MBS3767906.1 aminoglycoside 6-adenylyltransferase [Candidatus Cloacimonadota bacterium]